MFSNHKFFILKVKIFHNQNNQKGVIILLAVIIMGLLLSIAVGVSTILLKQLAMFKSIENSLQAFYAAETGIEEASFCFFHLTTVCEAKKEYLDPDTRKISYSYSITTRDGSDVAISKGSYQGSQRKIETILE